MGGTTMKTRLKRKIRKGKTALTRKNIIESVLGRSIRGYTVHFRKIHSSKIEKKVGENSVGKVSYRRKKIYIDLSDEHEIPARVFLHEIIHVLRPSLPEIKVQHLEKNIWKRLTQKEKYLINRLLFMRPWRT